MEDAQIAQWWAKYLRRILLIKVAHDEQNYWKIRHAENMNILINARIDQFEHSFRSILGVRSDTDIIDALNLALAIAGIR